MKPYSEALSRFHCFMMFQRLMRLVNLACLWLRFHTKVLIINKLFESLSKPMLDLESQSPVNLSSQRVLIRNKDLIRKLPLYGNSRCFLYHSFILNSTTGENFYT